MCLPLFIGHYGYNIEQVVQTSWTLLRKCFLFDDGNVKDIFAHDIVVIASK